MINGNKIKDIKKSKKKKAIKDRRMKDIKKPFEKKEEHYYKAVRVGNFYSNNYIEYESNGDRKKTLSIEKYLIKIRPHLADIINNLKKSDS